MTETKVPYKFDSGYVTDLGTTLQYNLSLSPPSDLSTANIDAILGAIGASRRTGATVPCGERGTTRPRRVKYIRDNGSSFSVVIPDRSNLLAAAETIWNTLNTLSIKPVCAQLEGEFSRNLIDDLRPAQTTNQACPKIEPSVSDGKHVGIYSGVMRDYKSDATYGATILMGFKSQTDAPGQAYSGLRTEIDTCVGQLSTVQGCGGAAQPREYRRFVPELITTQTTGSGPTAVTNEFQQSVTVPVASHLPAEITTCGEDLATIACVICLPYYGESNSRLHKLF